MFCTCMIAKMVHPLKLVSEIHLGLNLFVNSDRHEVLNIFLKYFLGFKKSNQSKCQVESTPLGDSINFFV